MGVKGGMGRVWVAGALMLSGLAGAWMPAAAQQETIAAIRHGEKLLGGLEAAAPGGGDAHAGARANGLAALPALPDKGIAQPAGEAGGLKVLNWAGFSSAVSYTFDDSLASQLAHYAELHATGVRMTFFQVSGTGGKADWQQVVDDGNELGNHTAHHCHANGSGCGWGKWAGSAAAEYDACNEFLKQSYGVGAVWDTASPYGDTGYDATASTMFFLNRGVWNGQIAPDDATDPYNLVIYGAAAGDTEAVFDAHIDEARKAGKWQIFLVHSLGGDGGYAPIDAAGLLASIRHAQAFGDVWLDDMVNIGAYWAGQKAIENGTVTREYGTTTIRWTLPPHFPPGRHVRVTVTGGRVTQDGVALKWNGAGYYDVALDAGELTIAK
ncbi:MAG TPA: polysaccharide deacetylase family protein [Terracidiphilus sp.]|nr:polysaccharide deacetylase family protein [Terracidiphilus sp.]